MNNLKSLKHEIDLKKMIAQISSGNALLFAGSGFSINCKNINSKEPLMAKGLARKICNLGDFGEDDDLAYATNYYLDNNKKEDLIKFLTREYTINEVDEAHKVICGLKWKRYYTTNYDNTIELATNACNKQIETIDISFNTNDYYQRENLCIHLNGSIKSLTKDTLNNSFKLSTSSYLDATSFKNSDWFYIFKRDLERSSAIIFVGYSLYDIEIQKILFQNPDFIDKTYFITENNPSHKTEYKLSQFGTVVPIETKGFAKLITQNIDKFEENDTYYFGALTKYNLINQDVEIRDADIEKMILYGDVSEIMIENGVLSEQKAPYLIYRECTDKLISFIKESKNIIISSEMGNGKSIIIEQLKVLLTVESYDCYEISDIEADYIADFDEITKKNKESILILDNYEKYLDLIHHYCNVVPDNLIIVATARTTHHDRLQKELVELNFEFNDINIDYLRDTDKQSLVDIIDNLGMWGEKSNYSDRKKISHITKSFKSQFSLTLLDLMNAPQIKSRIEKPLNELMKDKETNNLIFTICFLDLLNLPLTFSLISEIADSDYIYNSSIRNNRNFNELFKIDATNIVSKSSLFSLSLIKNHYSPYFIIEKLLSISESTDKRKNEDSNFKEVFKATMRFSFIEPLLPELNKNDNLKNYYEKLKNNISWLKKNPHYWLQYAMAQMNFKDYQKAQTYLDNAYSFANSDYFNNKIFKYDTAYIDSQQSRLYLLRALNSNPKERFNYFIKGHMLKKNLVTDLYKFKEITKYQDFYDKYYQSLSKKQKVEFQHACKDMLKEIEKAPNDFLWNTNFKKAEEILKNLVNLFQ